MQDKSCVIFFERKIQGSDSAGSYISLEEVILNKSLTRRKANITAQQYHLSLDKYHKSVHGFIQLPNPLQGLGFAECFLLVILFCYKIILHLRKLFLSYNKRCSSTRPIYKKMTKRIYLWKAQKDGPRDVKDGTNYRLYIGQKQGEDELKFLLYK